MGDLAARILVQHRPVELAQVPFAGFANAGQLAILATVDVAHTAMVTRRIKLLEDATERIIGGRLEIGPDQVAFGNPGFHLLNLASQRIAGLILQQSLMFLGHHL